MVDDGNKITGPGSTELASACREYLRLGEPALPQFIDRLLPSRTIASGRQHARPLAEYMSEHSEDPSFGRVSAILKRCK